MANNRTHIFIKRVIQTFSKNAKLEDLINEEKEFDSLYSSFTTKRDEHIAALTNKLEPLSSTLSPEIQEQIKQEISKLEKLDHNSPTSKENDVLDQWDKSSDKNLEKIADEIISTAELLHNYINRKLKNLRNNINSVVINKETDAYKEVVDFLSQDDKKEILLLLSSPAKDILNNISLANYVQIINAIKSSIVIEKTDPLFIVEFDREKANRLWERSRLKQLQSQHLQSANNHSLVRKILDHKDTSKHLLLSNEISSIIQHMQHEDKIHVAEMNENEIACVLEDVEECNQTLGRTDADYSFYLMLNTARENDTQSRWAAAIFTVSNGAVLMEYADSASSSKIPTPLKNTVKEKFDLVTFRTHGNVLKQAEDWEDGYLALFNIIRHIEKDVPHKSCIGEWGNEINSITVLRHFIQDCALENYQLRNQENNPDFAGLKIHEKLNGKKDNDDLPFHRLVQDSLVHLTRYKDNRTSQEYSTDYAKRIGIANKMIEAFKACKSNDQLEEIYRQIEIDSDLNELRDNKHFTSELITILELIKNKIGARQTIQAVRKSDVNAEDLYREILRQLKAIPSDMLVEPNQYSWLGHEIIADELTKANIKAIYYPIEHTVKDELIGKLYFIKRNETLDHATRCTDMRCVISETKAVMAKSWHDSKSTFCQELSRLGSTVSDNTITLQVYDNYMRPSNKPDYTVIRQRWDTNKTIKIGCSRNQESNAALALLRHYSRTGISTLFSSECYHRQHDEMVRTALDMWEKSDDVSVKDILQYFSRQLTPETTHPAGELMKILTFMAAEANTTFNLCLNPDASQKYEIR